MLALLKLPVELLWLAFILSRTLFDRLRGRRSIHASRSVLINAPRDAVWRFVTADRMVLDGPPTMEFTQEPLAGTPELNLVRVVVGGRETTRVVSQEIERDDVQGRLRSRCVPHELWLPQDMMSDGVTTIAVDEQPDGTLFIMSFEANDLAFKPQLTYPMGIRWNTVRIARQCEKAVGIPNRFAAWADNGLILSIIGALSFWYLFGWQDALLLTVVILLHELGHAAAMRIVGIPVHGIYLVPFFGGAAVPKQAYQSQAHLGFVALMGPGFSLIPTLGLAVLFWWIGDTRILPAITMFAIINAVNLLPIYPLDGGQILNALLGSFSGRLAGIVSWIGVLAGLGIAVWLQSFLIGVPFLLFAFQRYISGGRMGELRRLSVPGAAALAVAFLATFALHAGAAVYAHLMDQAIAGNATSQPPTGKAGVPVSCDLPTDSAGILKRYLRETQATAGSQLLYTLALADRAGQGDVLRDWDARPEMLKQGTRASRTLLLARFGSMSEITAELAKVTDETTALAFRAEMTAALLAFGRRDDAFTLFPAGGTATAKENWFGNLLAQIDGTTMTFRDALTLLGRIEPRLERAVLTGFTQALARRAFIVSASAEDKAALLNRLVADLDAIASDRAGALSQADSHGLLIQLGGPALRTLDLYYSELASLPELFGAVAAGWMDRGDTGKLDDLRRRADEAFAPKPSVLTQDGLASQIAYSREEWQNYFETVAATTRLAWRLDRHDVAAAEALIAEMRQQMQISGWGMNERVSRYYLAAGDWEQAELWHRRLNASVADDKSLARIASDAAADYEYGYQISRAVAALHRARADVARPAIDIAAASACKLALKSVYQRHLWAEFLRMAYLMKTVEEGRLPPQILGNLFGWAY